MKNLVNAELSSRWGKKLRAVMKSVRCGCGRLSVCLWWWKMFQLSERMLKVLTVIRTKRRRGAQKETRDKRKLSVVFSLEITSLNSSSAESDSAIQKELSASARGWNTSDESQTQFLSTQRTFHPVDKCRERMRWKKKSWKAQRISVMKSSIAKLHKKSDRDRNREKLSKGESTTTLTFRCHSILSLLFFNNSQHRTRPNSTGVM